MKLPQDKEVLRTLVIEKTRSPTKYYEPAFLEALKMELSPLLVGMPGFTNLALSSWLVVAFYRIVQALAGRLLPGASPPVNIGLEDHSHHE